MREMPRRACLALLLTAALTALALSAALDVAEGDTSPRARSDRASFALRAASVSGTATRLTGDDRREGFSGERTLEHRLVLVAVLAALLGLAHMVWRGVVVQRRRTRPVSSFWSPQAGRSPPSSLSIA